MSAVPALRIAYEAPREDIVFEVEEGYPLVPDAVYAALCLGCEVRFAGFGSAIKAFMRFRIAEGPHAGTVLWRAYGIGGRIIPGKGPGSGPRPQIKRRSKLFKMISRVLNLPVNTRAHRVSLHELKGRLCRIQTRTVVRDGEQNELPEAARYSVVEDVLSVETN